MPDLSQPREIERATQAVVRVPRVCPGGRECTCCGPLCDCGCRDECPAWQGAVERLECAEKSEAKRDVRS